MPVKTNWKKNSQKSKKISITKQLKQRKNNKSKYGNSNKFNKKRVGLKKKIPTNLKQFTTKSFENMSNEEKKETNKVNINKNGKSMKKSNKKNKENKILLSKNSRNLKKLDGMTSKQRKQHIKYEIRKKFYKNNDSKNGNKNENRILDLSILESLQKPRFDPNKEKMDLQMQTKKMREMESKEMESMKCHILSLMKDAKSQGKEFDFDSLQMEKPQMMQITAIDDSDNENENDNDIDLSEKKNDTHEMNDQLFLKDHRKNIETIDHSKESEMQILNQAMGNEMAPGTKVELPHRLNRGRWWKQQTGQPNYHFDSRKRPFDDAMRLKQDRESVKEIEAQLAEHIKAERDLERMKAKQRAEIKKQNELRGLIVTPIRNMKKLKKFSRKQWKTVMKMSVELPNQAKTKVRASVIDRHDI